LGSPQWFWCLSHYNYTRLNWVKLCNNRSVFDHTVIIFLRIYWESFIHFQSISIHPILNDWSLVLSISTYFLLFDNQWLIISGNRKTRKTFHKKCWTIQSMSISFIIFMTSLAHILRNCCNFKVIIVFSFLLNLYFKIFNNNWYEFGFFVTKVQSKHDSECEE